MTNYFHILQLPVGASDSEVRKAYRKLAKQFHPDINPSPDAQKKFQEISTAYEFLTDRAQRKNYESLLSEERMSPAEQARRENIYRLWVEHQQRQKKYRDAMASAYAQRGKKVPYQKLYGRANYFTNVISLVIFFSVTLIPIYKYVDEQINLPESQQRSFITFLIPSLLGAVLFFLGYYYWFVLKSDKQS